MSRLWAWYVAVQLTRIWHQAPAYCLEREIRGWHSTQLVRWGILGLKFIPFLCQFYYFADLSNWYLKQLLNHLLVQGIFFDTRVTIDTTNDNSRRVLYRRGVPRLQDLMPDDMRWSWCNNNRNKVQFLKLSGSMKTNNNF